MMDSFRLLCIYRPHILELEYKDKYQKIDLLSDKFLIAKSNTISIYYSAHNEVINKKADILIVGICPGFRQMEMSIRYSKQLLNKNLSDNEILRRVKLRCRLFGSTRSNLIDMLNNLEVYKSLKISSSDILFDDNYDRLHTTSLIRYPVFINGNNYNGNSPSLLKNEFLFDIASRSIKEEINSLGDIKLILPLGKAVEKFLFSIYEENENIYRRIIRGFPHPSGLNGHRMKFFKENFNDLKLQFGSLLNIKKIN